MSYRIGIDIESISDVQAAAEKHKQFLDKVLTKSEQKQLAGRKGNG
ncbi:4'-phosphopantetheinyl transferase family protein, partial [Oenococcus oeni]